MVAFLFWVAVINTLQSLPVYVIAKKMESDHAFFAFFPILQIILLLELDDKSWQWVLVCTIPGFVWVLQAFLWANIAERLGKPVWIGACSIIPGIGIIPMYYIAFYQDPDAEYPDLLEEK
ncbi:MAG: hypothetical protein WCL39_06525 [Armatimonadota bacterium]